MTQNGKYDFKDIIKKAGKLVTTDEQKDYRTYINDFADKNLKCSSDEIAARMKKLNPHLEKFRLRNATTAVWKQGRDQIKSLRELLNKARERSGIDIEKVASMGGLTEKTIKEFEENSIPTIERQDISVLVKILCLFGIKSFRLAKIIKKEEEVLRSDQPFGMQAEYSLEGVKGRKIIGRHMRVRPSEASFLSDVEKEMEKQENDE